MTWFLIGAGVLVWGVGGSDALADDDPSETITARQIAALSVLGLLAWQLIGWWPLGLAAGTLLTLTGAAGVIARVVSAMTTLLEGFGVWLDPEDEPPSSDNGSPTGPLVAFIAASVHAMIGGLWMLGSVVWDHLAMASTMLAVVLVGVSLSAMAAELRPLWDRLLTALAGRQPARSPAVDVVHPTLHRPLRAGPITAVGVLLILTSLGLPITHALTATRVPADGRPLQEEVKLRPSMVAVDWATVPGSGRTGVVEVSLGPVTQAAWQASTGLDPGCGEACGSAPVRGVDVAAWQQRHPTDRAVTAEERAILDAAGAGALLEWPADPDVLLVVRQP